MLKKILENGKIIAMISAATLFVSSVLLVLYGVYALVETVINILSHFKDYGPAQITTKFIGIMDIHMVAIVLYIFAIGMYKLMVGPLNVPDYVKIETIDDLKSKLASILILIIAITFTKEVVEWKSPLETLYFAVAIALVGGLLIFYIKSKDSGNKNDS